MGPATSFLRGIEESSADWLFFSLADLPFITGETYQELFTKRTRPGCRPVFKSIPGHPVLISHSLIPEIITRSEQFLQQPLTGELTMKSLVGPLQPLPWADKAVISDIDTAQRLSENDPV